VFGCSDFAGVPERGLVFALLLGLATGLKTALPFARKGENGGAHFNISAREPSATKVATGSEPINSAAMIAGRALIGTLV